MSSSYPFLGFSLLVVLAYYASRSSGWRHAILLIANVAFLATFWQGLLSYVPFVAFLLLAYAGLQLIRISPQRTSLAVIVATLAGFIWLKKYAFVPATLYLPFTYVTVGLSYLLFRVLHLMIDTRTGALPEKIGLFSYFNYTVSFTTLTLGPIQRYQDYVEKRKESLQATLTAARMAVAGERIIKGLFKINVLALLFSTAHTRMIDAVAAESTAGAKFLPGVLILVLYALFIYCNFSGFIDIVIGVGLLLGSALPENFERPFFADNFLNFWTNRWHMTLSAWWRMYIYNPMLLALMRRFPSRRMEPVWAVVVFFVTFFIVGLWHGQTSEFVFYGLTLGLGVSVNKAYQLLMISRMGRKSYARLSISPLYIAVSRGLTFTYFTFTLVWFWATWHQMRELHSALGNGMTVTILLGIFCGSTILLSVWEATRHAILDSSWNNDPALSRCFRVAFSTALLVITVAVSVLMNQPAPEIVYKAF